MDNLNNKLSIPKEMVYKIFVDGENYDAQGGLVYFSKIFLNITYGQALRKAEELLRMIDEGVVGVTEGKRSVYIARKNFDSIKRVELN